MARYYECTICDAALKEVYALDDTQQICINCAEVLGILDRQVPVSWMVEQIRDQIAAEKTGKSVQDLYLTGSVQRLVPDGEVFDIRLREGLKDFYDVVSHFQVDEAMAPGFPSAKFVHNESLQRALKLIIGDCTTHEEFETWLAKIKNNARLAQIKRKEELGIIKK